MVDPIPLSAPDGTVMAWACGECRRVYGIVRGFPPPEKGARECCAGCPACRKWSSGGPCPSCTAAGRRAFEALGAIGMAVAVREYGIAAFDRVTTFEESLAALCGVDVETVRGWR